MVRDLNGVEVNVGDSVRILSVDDSILNKLESDEKARVMSMIGEMFEVYEIDEYGQAWVEKWWNQGSSESINHSLGLSSNNMQVVKSDR